MAASLRELLTEEAYQRGNNNNNKAKFVSKSQKPVKYIVLPDDSSSLALLPIHICHDRKSYDFSKHKAQSSVLRKGSSRRVSSTSERSNAKTVVSQSSRKTEPAAIDEVATKAVVSILSGYAGRYIKEEEFREETEEKCKACLARNIKDSGNGVLDYLELGVESVNKFVAADQGFSSRAMRKCIDNLCNVVTLLNSNKSKMNASSCGIPNSSISACAQLYLSFVHKLQKNDLVAAKHLLQVFCDSPFLARTHLLPDLWEHLFLPHLLHLKIWYTKEIDGVSSSFEMEKRMKSLNKVYNDQVNLGTTKFAQYYKEWLKVGAEAPPVAPDIPLPSIPSSRSRRRRASDSSFASHSSLNKNLYQAVFGPIHERQSVDLDNPNGVSNAIWDVEEECKVFEDEVKLDNYNSLSYVHREDRTRRKSSSQSHRSTKPELWPESEQTKKSGYFGFFGCQSEPSECLVNRNLIVKSNSNREENNSHLRPSSNLSNAISTLYSSDNLSDCEIAVRAITRAWLDSHGDPVIQGILSEPPLIQGMLEVLFASTDDEVLELVISVLAEFVARNEQNRIIILNFDPQLDIFMRILRSSGLFLKAAVLLYLLKPKAKQMISLEWVALALRVLEFGDQLQTLFTVRCKPQAAALYFLDELLRGFDEERNLENARQVISSGGLTLLVTQIEKGDTDERNKFASIIACCVRADGSCRNYLADFLNKPSLLELIVLRNGSNSTCSAFALLIEILCLSRRTKITKILDELKVCYGLNTMQILLVYLQRASPKERPLVAAILLQLDIMGDPSKCSVYREEAIEAIISALDCRTYDEKVQERSARSLLMLGGWFSYTGEASTEHWLLQQAGFSYWSRDSFHFKGQFLHSNEDEEATENWQRKAATALFRSGNKNLLVALSDSIANGVPSLARVSLVTLSWMSSFLSTVGDGNLKAMACSVLVPQLLESLNFDKDVEERVLASYSLLNLVKSSGDEYIPMLSSVDKEVLSKLQNLSLVTWTANELISIITSNYED